MVSWVRFSSGVLLVLLVCGSGCGSSSSKGNGKPDATGKAGTGGAGSTAGTSGGGGSAAGTSGAAGASGNDGAAGSDAAPDVPADALPDLAPEASSDGAGGSAADGGAGETGGDAKTDGASACPVDGAVVADPFAGVWTGLQGNETFTFTNNGGCSSWTGSSGSTLCDICTGTYVQTDAGVATAVLHCRPVGACSVSAAHMDTGPYKLSGCSITYDYDYGGGMNSFTAMRVADTTVNVCAQLDGGTD
jgi:hypothetical protein